MSIFKAPCKSYKIFKNISPSEGKYNREGSREKHNDYNYCHAQYQVQSSIYLVVTYSNNNNNNKSLSQETEIIVGTKQQMTFSGDSHKNQVKNSIMEGRTEGKKGGRIEVGEEGRREGRRQ